MYSNSNSLFEVALCQGTVGSGTQLQSAHLGGGTTDSGIGYSCNIIAYLQPSPGSITYNVALNGAGNSAGLSMECGSTYPGYIVAELV